MPETWTVLSPDGFPPTPDAEYATYGEAVDALAEFLKRFEAQGYYLNASRERIPLEVLHTECAIAVDEEGQEASPTDPACETNVEFVTRLMESSPMIQLVVIEALTKYTGRVIENEAAVLKSFEGTMIHGPAWVSACRTLADELGNKYGRG